LVEIKALPNPPRACVVTLGGMVVMLTDQIKKNGGEIFTKPIEG
jgi:dynein heavy chain